jgi:hypothetical protein
MSPSRRPPPPARNSVQGLRLLGANEQYTALAPITKSLPSPQVILQILKAMSVTVQVDGVLYSFCARATGRSKVLADLRDTAAVKEAPIVTELPLKRSWLEAWD